MNNLNESGRVTADRNRSLSATISKVGKSKVALGISAVVGLGLGGLFLINYPLPTIVVGLLMASIFVLERG